MKTSNNKLSFGNFGFFLCPKGTLKNPFELTLNKPPKEVLFKNKNLADCSKLKTPKFKLKSDLTS